MNRFPHVYSYFLSKKVDSQVLCKRSWLNVQNLIWFIARRWKKKQVIMMMKMIKYIYWRDHFLGFSSIHLDKSDAKECLLAVIKRQITINTRSTVKSFSVNRN